ncbi:hypothetical protein AB0O75_49025 [Streptomyces sp. NPDC088921]|uniref:hypothetical protein n=1 Tax=unclassified Streptomyces TaxID=2593676 RepID=UPI003442B2D6
MAAGVIELHGTVIGMIAALKLCDRAMWHLPLNGWLRGKVADHLGIKTSYVDNARYVLRTKVKNLRKAGLLSMSPETEMGWARAKNTHKVVKGAAR